MPDSEKPKKTAYSYTEEEEEEERDRIERQERRRMMEEEEEEEEANARKREEEEADEDARRAAKEKADAFGSSVFGAASGLGTKKTPEEEKEAEEEMKHFAHMIGGAIRASRDTARAKDFKVP